MTINLCGPFISENVLVNIFATHDPKLRMPMGHVILCAVP